MVPNVQEERSIVFVIKMNMHNKFGGIFLGVIIWAGLLEFRHYMFWAEDKFEQFLFKDGLSLSKKNCGI